MHEYMIRAIRYRQTNGRVPTTSEGGAIRFD